MNTNSHARRFASSLPARVIRRIAPRYIAGPEINDAVALCQSNEQQGWRSAICPWDGPHDSPSDVAASYQVALHTIAEKKLNCYLSIKVPSLKYHFSLLEDLLILGAAFNIPIHFDSLSPDSASRSFVLLEKARKQYSNLGCTLPSRWLRSTQDAETAVQLGLSVRIVKGQWADPVEPSVDAEAHFLNLVDALAGRAPHVGVATHDVPLAREALSRLRAAGTPCELEQLYGLPNRAKLVALPMGIGVRIYVPYGYAYAPYALSQITKRPVILGWMLRDLLLSEFRVH